MNGIISAYGEIFLKYQFNSQMQVSKKDGQQQITLAVQSFFRFSRITEAMESSNILLNKVRFLPLILGILILLNQRLAKVTCLQQNSNFVYLSSKIDKNCRAILQESDKICYVAELVTGIAMIYFGQHLKGISVLIGLAIVSLKNRCLIPLFVEEKMQSLTMLANLISFYQSKSLSTRCYCLLELFVNFTEHSKKAMRNLYHRWIPIFEIPSRSESEQNELFKTLLKVCEGNPKIFTINPQYIYSPEVSRLPVDPKEITNEEIIDLFTKLNEKIEKENLFVEDPQKKEILTAGLKKLRKGILEGRIEDQIPDNFELFRKTMYALIESILADPVDFKKRIMDLAEVGDNCVERWTSETCSLFDPQTTDFRWAVHYALSKWRGNTIAETLCKQPSIEGGTNGVHLQNQFQRATLRYFRTFQGLYDVELRSLSLPEILSAILFPKKVFKINLKINKALHEHFQANVLALILTTGFINSQMISRIKSFSKAVAEAVYEHFQNPEAMVEFLYQAIKPRLEPDHENRLVSKRDIPLEAIRNWQAAMSEKYPNEDFSSPEYTKQDDAGEWYLTKRAIYFLLWDMGILDVSMKTTLDKHLVGQEIRSNRPFLDRATS